MDKVRLGKTNLEVNKIGFGALPIQRRNMDDSIAILNRAYESGVDFYDTARFYTDSEEKLGMAFEDVRSDIYLASKTAAETPEDFWNDLETTLKELRTDYLDLYQHHNISFCPKEGDELAKAMAEAKEEGVIRHIGITTHKVTLAYEALDSGLYETLQYPFSYLSGREELELVEKCRKLDVGFIAMKAMGGGLLKNAKASFAFMNQYSNVLPIWGIQHMSELEEFLSYPKDLIIDDSLRHDIEHDKEGKSLETISAVAADTACHALKTSTSASAPGCHYGSGAFQPSRTWTRGHRRSWKAQRTASSATPAWTSALMNWTFQGF